MKISKAIKYENSKKNAFLTLMAILFTVLPIIDLLSQSKVIFLWLYLGAIEALILTAFIATVNYHNLKFKILNNRLRVKAGLFSETSTILCDKVAVVHTIKFYEDMSIILITTSKSNNKYLKEITPGFLKKFPEAEEQYLKFKNVNDDQKYYFQIIKIGALKKYVLLESIYKNCVRAYYTAPAIENIKVAREQIEI